MSDDTVIVPRELLRKVLYAAAENADLAAEWLVHPAWHGLRGSLA